MKLSAPEILAVDEANGFLLLEDLGDDTFARVLAERWRRSRSSTPARPTCWSPCTRRPTTACCPASAATKARR